MTIYTAIRRLLIAGHVAAAPRPVTANLTEITVDAPVGLGVEVWRVLASTPEANDEAMSLREGDAVACTGDAQRFNKSGWPINQLTADHILVLRPRPRDDAAPFIGLPSEIAEGLQELEETAVNAGAAHEHQRIAEIMNSRFAREQLALVWRLAEGGEVTLAQAEEALSVQMLSGLTPAPDGDGIMLEN